MPPGTVVTASAAAVASVASTALLLLHTTLYTLLHADNAHLHYCCCHCCYYRTIKAFALHIKPTCVKNRITCAPYTDALLSSNYNTGMHKCFGNGWLADPLPLLTELATVSTCTYENSVCKLCMHISYSSDAAGLLSLMEWLIKCMLALGCNAPLLQ